MEAQSLALAYQLQQEEHAALMQAVRVSSPGLRPASGAGSGPQHMETSPSAEDDGSLQLALRLQQEELQWHAAGVNVGVDEDEDVRLAMQLSQEAAQADDNEDV